MIEIGKYFFNDDFKFEEEIFHGVSIFCDGKHIYLAKDAMLYENAIGQKCEKCGELISKSYYSTCKSCREKQANENYLKLQPFIETEYLYSDFLDEHFDKDDWSPIYDYLSTLTYDEIINLKFTDLRIHPCSDAFAQTIDISTYFEDVCEEFDLGSYGPIVEINEHVNAINELIKNNPTGYEPIMNKRIIIDEQVWNDMKHQAIEENKNENS